jgi:hypothetical protein
MQLPLPGWLVFSLSVVAEVEPSKEEWSLGCQSDKTGGDAHPSTCTGHTLKTQEL